MSGAHADEQEVWRENYTHYVMRFTTPGCLDFKPCFCWATHNHHIGYELSRTLPGKPS